MTNQEHGLPFQSLVDKDRRLPRPKSHKHFHSTSTSKVKIVNKTILWTVWSVFCGPWSLKLKPRNKAFDNVESVTLFKYCENKCE